MGSAGIWVVIDAVVDVIKNVNEFSKSVCREKTGQCGKSVRFQEHIDLYMQVLKRQAKLET